MIKILRKLLWRILGIDYAYMQKIASTSFLSDDAFTSCGAMTYNNNAIVMRWSKAPISIGKYCSISSDVRFIADNGKHNTNIVSSYPFKGNEISPKQGITIGNDVWIGVGATILYGVTIGDGATIAAGAVVSSDVAPYTVVGGVPAKTIRQKCTEQEATQMQKIAWWDWDKSDIDLRISDFKLSIPDFISKYATNE